MLKKVLKWFFIISFIIILILLYKTYNPGSISYFPKCPFKEFTGLKCPGCGSQRSIHYLLNFEFLNAFKANAILVLSIPYLLLGFIFDIWRNPSERVLKWRKVLFGQKAIMVVLVIIISFWIVRNLFTYM